jgi:uncharacterized cupredoxin-like copper-binding protein
MLKRTILLAASLLVVAGCDQVESSSRQLLDATAKSAKQAIDDTHQAANKALDDAKQELSVLDIKPAQIEDKRDQ